MASYYITLGCQLQKKTDDVMPTQEIKYSVPVSKTFISPPVSRALFFIQFINPSIIPIMGSYTLKPRSGLVGQIIRTLRPTWSGWINKIGLRNKGIDYAIKNYKKGHIVSIALLNITDINKINNKIYDDMDIELNVSCPNTEKDMISENLDVFLCFQIIILPLQLQDDNPYNFHKQ